jgi:hypothetical protein
VFVYDKTEDRKRRTGTLEIQHLLLVDAVRTGDYQTTRGLREILDRDGNEDDLAAFLRDRNLPVDDIEARAIAQELLKKRPEQGYLTISNALQWRLQYGHALKQSGQVAGVVRL